MAQSLRQQQGQFQKLSPQQIQLMKLLQVPTGSLEERVDIEIQENPALEYKNEQEEDSDINEKTREDLDKERKAKEETETRDEYDYGNFDVKEYLGAPDDRPNYEYGDSHYNGSTDDDVAPAVQYKLEESFHELLQSQIKMMDLKPEEKLVAEFLVGSIDDDGYLRRDKQSLIDDLAFRQNIKIDKASLEYILDKVKSLDPPGLCAADLRECLLLQLIRKKQGLESGTRRENILLAIKTLEKYFDEFSKKHYDKIVKAFSINNEKLKEVIGEIVKLNPRPGGMFTANDKVASFLIPDFTVFNEEGELRIQLNSRNAPELRISGHYRNMLEDYAKNKKRSKEQKDAVMFIKQKIDSAKWFIDAIKQRQNTLMLTMDTILRLQEAFFFSGDETDIRPMILKDISDRTGFDISTISRVVNSKFVQTEFGTFKLKFFFSEGLSTTDGDDVSTKQVKKVLHGIIDEEDKKKPLSDEKLTDFLIKKGYKIARRTVAKYREQLNIPVARLRKQL